MELSKTKRPKILFITRKYPPSVGGMQRLSYQFVKWVGMRVDINAIAWGGSQAWLFWFLLRSLVQGLWLAHGVDILYAGDPLVAPVVWLLARLYRKPAIVNVHGLDLTFNFPGYQALMPRLLRRFTYVICISQATYERALMLRLAPQRCRIIHPGVEMPQAVPTRAEARAQLKIVLGRSLAKRQVWLTVGRLVPRKGVAWFCDQVLPRLCDVRDFVYLVAGDGPEMSRVRTLVNKHNLTEHVYLLGRVSDEVLTWLYAGADAFIMPNIPWPHDYEGFGLVAIEAAAHGLPVIAARLEGIQDAVIEGASGYLLPPQDAAVWIAFLRRCVRQPWILEALRSRAREVVATHFGWDKITEQYLKVFHEVLAEQQGAWGK